MKPSRHVIASFSAGLGMWYVTKSIPAAALCFLTGVLIDLDHILEYMIHFGFNGLSYKNVYTICEKKPTEEGGHRFKKYFLIFHCHEISILLWIGFILTKNIYVFAIALGHTLHMILDCIGNPVHAYVYSIIWRFMNDFDLYKHMRY